MKFRICLYFIFGYIGFGLTQDTIVKYNNQRVYGDIYEVTQSLIVYIETKGDRKRIRKIRKKHVFYIIYSNHQIERIPYNGPPSPSRMRREKEMNLD